MLAQCPNDLTAILLAREVTRRGELVEVWRDDRLVYRVGSGSDPVKPHKGKQRSKTMRWNLAIFRGLAWNNRGGGT
jgi:hypothetical protein